MRVVKNLWVVILVLLSVNCYAQRSNNSKSSVTRTRHANAARVRGVKAKTICPIFDNNKYPYQGLGIKLGDPFSITYKFYMSEKFAAVIDFGKTASGLYTRYFREKFSSYVNADTFSLPEPSVRYVTHKIKSDLVGEVKCVYQFDVKEVSPGMQLYLGAGWEWKNTRIQYNYIDDSAMENEVERFSRTRLTMGPQIVAGIEYAYFQIPVSAFIEIEYFTDIQADPGLQRFEGGIGLRYIF